jgi:hypothetical protein
MRSWHVFVVSKNFVCNPQRIWQQKYSYQISFYWLLHNKWSSPLSFTSMRLSSGTFLCPYFVISSPSPSPFQCRDKPPNQRVQVSILQNISQVLSEKTAKILAILCYLYMVECSLWYPDIFNEPSEDLFSRSKDTLNLYQKIFSKCNLFQYRKRIDLIHWNNHLS